MVEVSLFECASDFSVVRERVVCYHPLECALQSAGRKRYKGRLKHVGVVGGRNIACLSKNIKYVILS